MELHIPWLPLLALGFALLLLATVTTLLSARSAMSGNVVRAVKDDW
jgi:putative ABC transport system permease protein